MKKHREGVSLLTRPNLLIIQGEIGPVYVGLLFFFLLEVIRAPELWGLSFTEFHQS